MFFLCPLLHFLVWGDFERESGTISLFFISKLFRGDFALKAGQNGRDQMYHPFVKEVKLTLVQIPTYLIRLSLAFSNVVLVTVMSFDNPFRLQFETMLHPQ